MSISTDFTSLPSDFVSQRHMMEQGRARGDCSCAATLSFYAAGPISRKELDIGSDAGLRRVLGQGGMRALRLAAVNATRGELREKLRTVCL